MSVYAPGAFCWAELATSDAEKARHFYCELFHWTVRETSFPGGSYLFFLSGGKEAASGYQARPEAHPHWNVYFAVENADAAASAAEAGGARILTAPFEAMDAGRMANIQDPQGALFSIWQARNFPGFAHQGLLDRVCWAELASPDPGAAAAFYTRILPWGTKPQSGLDSAEYVEWTLDGKSFGGMIPMRGDMWKGVPPHWSLYISVADCDERAAKAKELGAAIYVPPKDIPNVGRFSVLADPQGAAFSIIQLTGMM